MELHAVISQRPIISNVGISLSHDALNTKSFETSRESRSAVDLSVIQILKSLMRHLPVTATNDEDIGLNFFYATKATARALEKRWIFWMNIQILKICAENPNLPS
jgi:hypothetical protein